MNHLNQCWILLIGPLGTDVRELVIKSFTFSFKKMHLIMSSGKWCPFWFGRNVSREGKLLWINLCQVMHPSTKLYIAPVGDRQNSPRLRCIQIRQWNVYCWYIAPSFETPILRQDLLTHKIYKFQEKQLSCTSVQYELFYNLNLKFVRDIYCTVVLELFYLHLAEF